VPEGAEGRAGVADAPDDEGCGYVGCRNGPRAHADGLLPQRRPGKPPFRISLADSTRNARFSLVDANLIRGTRVYPSHAVAALCGHNISKAAHGAQTSPPRSVAQPKCAGLLHSFPAHKERSPYDGVDDPQLPRFSPRGIALAWTLARRVARSLGGGTVAAAPHGPRLLRAGVAQLQGRGWWMMVATSQGAT
jgi:hypothetical protein